MKTIITKTPLVGGIHQVSETQEIEAVIYFSSGTIPATVCINVEGFSYEIDLDVFTGIFKDKIN